MKKANKLISLVLVLMLALTVCFVGCNGDKPNGDNSTPTSSETQTPTSSDAGTTTSSDAGTATSSSAGGSGTQTGEFVPGTDYAANTVLRMATGYNSNDTGIVMDSTIAGAGVTLADGQTYLTGDLKPTWAFLEKELKVKYENKYNGKKSSANYAEFKDNMGTIDMISMTASDANQAGEEGQLVDIAQYLDRMPNFKAYLDANPIVRLSITGNTDTGAIYFSPYFDGSDDIERMPLMRVDMVQKLLNGAGEFTAEASKNLNASVYTPYMPETGKVEVEVVNPTTLQAEKLVKDYDKAGNIVKKMNDALAAGTVTGVQAVNMLRKYIDEAYNGYYGENRADLFIGQNAAWDVDEMVALLRCVVANPQTLNGTDTIQGLFAREHNMQRFVDMFRFAGSLFGVRGLESRSDYLYFDKEGNLQDARNHEDTYVALEKMNAMKQEGLIEPDFGVHADDDTNKSEMFIKNSTGFMSYDYNQTQTIYNKNYTKGEKYRAVLVPVAKWMDGSSETGKYMRFTESWRSVKTDCWAISAAGVEGNADKLNAALKLIDYAYSVQGQITMSYGPDAFIDVKDPTVVVKTQEDVAKKYNTFDFNGQQWPKINAKTFAELNERASGNYTNYARKYLGSTLSFLKSQAFEVQCTHEVGKEGATIISNAVAAGVIYHPLLAVNKENMWYTSMPTVLPTTDRENTAINKPEYANLLTDGMYSQSKKKENKLVDIIKGGYAATGEFNTREEAIKKANDWGVDAIVRIKQGAVARLLEYYNKTTNKN